MKREHKICIALGIIPEGAVITSEFTQFVYKKGKWTDTNPKLRGGDVYDISWAEQYPNFCQELSRTYLAGQSTIHECTG